MIKQKSVRKIGLSKSIKILIAILVLVTFMAILFISDTSNNAEGDSSIPEDEEATPQLTVRERAKQLTVDEIKAKAITISYIELMRYNEDYVGEIVYYMGGVIDTKEVSKGKYMLIIATEYFDGIYIDDVLYVVEYEGTRLLEDDIVGVWGENKGLKTYRTPIGGDNTAPEITALHIEYLGRSEY